MVIILIALIMVKTMETMVRNNKQIIYALLPFLNDSILKMPDSLSAVNKIIFGVLIFTIVILYSIINIIGYFGSLYIIKHTELESKYPKWSRIIKYYQKSNIVLLIIEIIFVISVLLFIIGFCIYLLYYSNEI